MEKFDKFVEILKTLRSDHGCPWDREQTHKSLRQNLIEEAYEVIESIDNDDNANLREELGDVLLQIVMHSVIAEEENAFTIEDVIDEVSEKMIRRHPHVFGDVEADTSEEVLKNWDAIKKQEKQEKTIGESMQRIPKALPANIRAEKVQKKAAKVGFDFSNYKEALEKVYEELRELEEAKTTENTSEIEEEFGDLLFALVNLSRFLQINAENSLTNATNKFINRFVTIEALAEKGNKQFSELSIDEMNELWEQVK